MPTMQARNHNAGKHGLSAMIESGFWIFLVETLGIGCMFVALIWWVVRGSDSRHRKLAEHDAAAAQKAVSNADTGSADKAPNG